MIKMNSAVHVILFIIFSFKILKSSQFPIENFNCKTPDGTLGSCIKIIECKPINSYIKHSNFKFSQALIQFLKEHTCDYIGRDVKICCSKDPNINKINISKFEPSNVLQKSNDVVHENAKLLPYNCGINKNRNMAPFETSLNSQEATLNEFPWIALLSYSKGQSTTFGCVGTIINERYILTTATCISEQLFSVRVGEHNTAETYDCERDDFNILKCSSPAEDIPVEKAFRHEEFKNSFARNDIGLIRLSKPINIYTENVKAICLPLKNFSTSIDALQIPLTLTGWGVTKKNFKSEVLLKADVSTISPDDCSQAYKKRSYDPMLSDKQFCIAGQPNGKSNLCGGDTGSPLQMLNGIRYTQYGIVSISPIFCEKKQMPYINTRVDRYIDWILNNIEP